MSNTSAPKQIDFKNLSGWQPRQLEATKKLMQDDCQYLLYGGAAGGGKSYWLRWLAVYLCIYYAAKYNAKGVVVGLFSETFATLNDRHLSRIPFEYPEWLGKMNKSEKVFTLNDTLGGGKIFFRNLDDPTKYLSSEFAAVLIDELTLNTRDIFDFLRMRMRWPGVPDTKFAAASNPGGPGHGWVKKFWIDRDFDGENLDPAGFHFVSAKYSDNSYLDPAYEKQLNALPDKLRQAYRDGDWDVFAGQYFNTWSEKHHVIEPFDIPDTWTRYVGVDYGTRAPFAGLYGAVDPDGNLYIYREAYQADLAASAQAELLLNRLDKDERIHTWIGDPSMWIKNQSTGNYLSSISDIYLASGIMPFIKGNNDRIHGWNRVREYLGNPTAEDAKERTPQKLFIFNTCRNLIRTLPAMVHDDAKEEDLNTKAEDHACDALRYLVMYVSAPHLAQTRRIAPDTRFGIKKKRKDRRRWW